MPVGAISRFRVPWQRDFADHGQIERQPEQARDLRRYRHAAGRDREYQRVRSPMLFEHAGQHHACLRPVTEHPPPVAHFRKIENPARGVRHKNTYNTIFPAET
jgi:hypothetical protein